MNLNIFYWLNKLLYILGLKKKKHAQTELQNYSTKRKKQVISKSLKILFQRKSNFFSSLQSCLIHIKLWQFGFSSHKGFC